MLTLSICFALAYRSVSQVHSRLHDRMYVKDIHSLVAVILSRHNNHNSRLLHN